ncbi:hypothetical protein [Kurthia zopfii]|uniref:hypothetical protein n=1 Tax=Kurthia zopfii TaxID=1650 RepID=UPI000F6E3BD0|nr:hypothetical protein [Kurthia zopfii]VEI07381.1 Uncharacterised protein [Kurthia zopfii]
MFFKKYFKRNEQKTRPSVQAPLLIKEDQKTVNSKEQLQLANQHNPFSPYSPPYQPISSNEDCVQRSEHDFEDFEELNYEDYSK